MIKKEVYAFSSSFLLPADNRSQRETRRRKRRWSGGRSVPRPPTGSTAPYCDQAHHLHHLSHAHTHTHTHQQTFGCQGTPQQWSNYGSTKGTGGWLRNDSMDPGRMKLIWNVGLGPSRCLGLSATPAPLTIWSFSKVFLLSLRTSPHLYSSLKCIVI